VTSSPLDQDHTSALTAPPPGCPAHGLGSAGIHRLYGPDAESDRMALYAQLRNEHGGVAPVLIPGDLRVWLVLGYRENLDVLRNPSRFSSDPIYFGEKIGPDHPLAPLTARQPLINFADGQEHQRLRAAVADSLARFNGRGIRHHAVRAAGRLIDDFAPAGRADLVGQFAELLPMVVMTQLLGMPEEPAPRLAQACRDLMQGTETAVASNNYILQVLTDLVERKKALPGHDLASWLIQHDARLEDREVVEHLRQVLVASNETTVNLIAETLRVVLTDDRFRAQLAGGSMTLPDALEDVLWNFPPLAVLPARYATGDTVLAEKTIKQGDMVLLGLAAGNVDPEIRQDLATSMQGNRSHLAFSSGPHECPGQNIGRAIAETAIDVLLVRLTGLHLLVPDNEMSRTPTWTSSHLDSLPVEFIAHRPKPQVAEDEMPGAASVPQPAAVPVPPVAGPPVPAGQSAPAAPGQAPQRTSWWRRLLGRG
jgi:cytochrome P450